MKCSSPDYVPPSRDKGGMVPICTTSQLPDKSVADSVEAIIGAYLLTCGPMGALKVGLRFFIIGASLYSVRP